MANSFAKTPPVWVVDTASATPIMTGQIFIDTIVVDFGTTGTAGSELKITDSAGNVIVDVFSTGANYEVFPRKIYVKGQWWNGLVVPTIGVAGAKAYIYLR